jgi:hypothetical protein
VGVLRKVRAPVHMAKLMEAGHRIAEEHHT